MTSYFGNWYTPHKRILYHFLFWIGIASIYYFNYHRLIGSNSSVWIFILKELLVTTAAFYSLSSGKILKIFTNQTGLIYILLWFILLYLFWSVMTYTACLIFKNSYNGYGPRFGEYVKVATTEGPFTVIRNTYLFGLDFIYLISLPIGPKLMKIMMGQIVERTKLERDNLELELNLLKSQLNPHFLFNTLNNIYQLLDVDKLKGREMVLKLSDMMRYTLYRSKSDFILLAHELQFLEDFIALMKLRYGKKIKIEVHIPDVGEPYKITPLLLIPYVENAFKHGPDKDPRNDYIFIHVKMDEDVLVLHVRNKVTRSRYENKSDNCMIKDGGVGLNNVLRRLQLYYNDKYHLDIGSKDGEHFVCLKVNLKSN